MTRAAILVGLLVAAHDPSCGGTDAPPSGPNAPCTRDHDCRDGLVCARGVCADSTVGDAGDDAHADAAISDAGGQ